MIRSVASILLSACLTLPFAAHAVEEHSSVRIRLDTGSRATACHGAITGYAFVDDLLDAPKRQRMMVSMTSDQLSNHFNVIAPGESDVAFRIGSTAGNRFNGPLPVDREYKIRVYPMRNAARRDETATYDLVVQITGIPLSGAEDVVAPGTPDHPRTEGD